MRLDEWLDGEPGRATKLAEHCRVSLSAVSQWRANGVPVGHMLSVRDFSGGDVSLEEMVASRTKPSASPSQHPATQQVA